MLGITSTIILYAIVGSLALEKTSAVQNHEVYEVTCPVVNGETEENILLAHESDCSKFYQCSFGIKYEHSCPSDLHFSVGAKRCEWPESAKCTLNPNTCLIVEEDPEEDILLPHETDCTKFYKCSFGKKVEFDCPEGLHYNPKKRYCDWPRNAKCRLGNGKDNSTNSCTLSEENQLYPHESDCNKFYQCSYKKKVERSCPENLHFNKKDSLCDWPLSAHCDLGKEPPMEETCSAEEQNNLYSHSSDCNKYYQCIFGKKLEYSCPKQLHFNAEKKVCDWPQNAQCEVTSENVCPPVTENPEDDLLFPHESDCTKFYKCSYGEKVLMTCQDGLHFNPNKGYCDWPENANCSLGEYPPLEETCSAEELNNLYSHNSDCNKYYQCIFGKKIEYSCPKQLHFNAEKKVCDWPQNAQCEVTSENKCPSVTENPEEDILFPHESDCTKFYKCSYGEKVLMTCQGGLHFNPNKGYCDWPQNAKCKLGEGPSEEKCSAEEQNNLYPHKSDCNKFYQCIFGKKVEQSCSANLHFNAEKKMCDWQNNSNCKINLNATSCPIVSENPKEDILLPHESDCTKFYKCSFGVKVVIPCPSGLHYNVAKRYCDWPRFANCDPNWGQNSTNSTGGCPNVEDDPRIDILLPHESDCTLFYKCTLGNKVLMNCPDNLHFNEDKQYCDYPNEANCKVDIPVFTIIKEWKNNDDDRGNSCPSVEEDPEDDILLPHEFDCSKFYKCSLGNKIEQDCPAGLYFNPEKNYCDWPENVECSQPESKNA